MLRLSRYISVLMLATVVAGLSPHGGFAAEPMTAARAADYAAIQTLIVKYAQAYDALDIEGYVGVFAEDAQFTFTGTTLNGRAEIRDFITKAANTPAAEPAPRRYHSISNTLIEFVSDTEAHHRSYWQIVAGAPGGPFVVGNMGVYEDVIVKINGEWLIQKRTIPP